MATLLASSGVLIYPNVNSVRRLAQNLHHRDERQVHRTKVRYDHAYVSFVWFSFGNL